MRVCSRSLAAAAILLSACELPTLIIGEQLDADSTTVLPTEAVTGDEDEPVLDLYLGDCEPPPAVSCDEDTTDPLQILGLDCIGGVPAAGEVEAAPGAVGASDQPLGPYPIREGAQMLILSTGIADHVGLSLTDLADVCEEASLDFCPSTGHDLGPFELPAPLTVDPVDPRSTCAEDPSLVGQGDCSNTLFAQLNACGGPCPVKDYAELRLSLTVPEQVYGLAFDFAFMSVEWPEGEDSAFNDMFVAWLESDAWTGNVSFDGDGNPITVKSSFRDYTGDDLAGFSMEGQAATRWLTTDVGVVPGETIELILAVFDVTDDSIDSVVLLDRVRWTCTGATPTTTRVP